MILQITCFLFTMSFITVLTLVTVKLFHWYRHEAQHNQPNEPQPFDEHSHSQEHVEATMHVDATGKLDWFEQKLS